MPLPTETGRPVLTTNVVVFTLRDEQLKLLLIRRRNPPFQGFWSLPGGVVGKDEDVEANAMRTLEDGTGLLAAQGTNLRAGHVLDWRIWHGNLRVRKHVQFIGLAQPARRTSVNGVRCRVPQRAVPFVSCGPLAQLAEHRPFKPGVQGSIP